MELREFVKTVLADVISGVKDAQDIFTSPDEGQANPAILIQGTSSGRVDVPTGCLLTTQKQLIQSVKFDVAVTVGQGSETKGGIGIFMGAIGVGSHGESTTSQTSVSRIQFEVPVLLPQSKVRVENGQGNCEAVVGS